MDRFTVCETDFGWVGIVACEAGISYLSLPRPSEQEALREVLDLHPGAVAGDEESFGELVSRLRRYFQGESVTFDDALDLSGGTAFQRRVWEFIRTIPRGETRSYGWVGAQVGCPRGARAIGQTMAINPIPIIVPCHRVVGGDGSLHGFGGGLEMKDKLLRLEGWVPGRR